jgi:hypothetical protein
MGTCSWWSTMVRPSMFPASGATTNEGTLGVDGRALFVNFRRAVVMHHFNFQKPVHALQFSPDGKCVPVH